MVTGVALTVIVSGPSSVFYGFFFFLRVLQVAHSGKSPNRSSNTRTAGASDCYAELITSMRRRSHESLLFSCRFGLRRAVLEEALRGFSRYSGCTEPWPCALRAKKKNPGTIYR